MVVPYNQDHVDSHPNHVKSSWSLVDKSQQPLIASYNHNVGTQIPSHRSYATIIVPMQHDGYCSHSSYLVSSILFFLVLFDTSAKSAFDTSCYSQRPHDTKPPILFDYVQTPAPHHEDCTRQSWHIVEKAGIPCPKNFTQTPLLNQ